jgi:hypothetical protein
MCCASRTRTRRKSPPNRFCRSLAVARCAARGASLWHSPRIQPWGLPRPRPLTCRGVSAEQPSVSLLPCPVNNRWHFSVSAMSGYDLRRPGPFLPVAPVNRPIFQNDFDVAAHVPDHVQSRCPYQLAVSIIEKAMTIKIVVVSPYGIKDRLLQSLSLWRISACQAVGGRFTERVGSIDDRPR